VATLDFFGTDEGQIRQTILDLAGPARYRVFDWLGMNLDRCVNEKQDNDGGNIWVALANIYVNTKYVSQWVDFLRYNDLEPWQGQWNSEKFIDSVKRWTEDDLKLMKQEKRD
jgi:hypothetical protein